MINAGEPLEKVMRNTGYGKCVYRCDNNVVDHQVVNMLFEGGATAQLTVTAFSAKSHRTVTVHCTRGEITGDMEENRLTLNLFKGRAETFDLNAAGGGALIGHGGGDAKLIGDFVDSLRAGKDCRSNITASLESHLMAFAAEKSRISGGCAVEIDGEI